MKFGVREIVDVVFKATADGQKIGDKTFKKYQPVFMIDTATTSSLEQATTTVYAQGGKGYNRLIAWEGEKTMTFTVTDALMSPMGLAVLTGAGLITPNKSNQAHVHATVNTYVDANGLAKITLDDINTEMGLDAISYDICNTIDMFATELDGSGAGINWFSNVTIDGGTGDYVTLTKDAPVFFAIPGAKDITVQLDFYVVMNNAVTEVHIEPSSFGGYFYVEAQTLFRREDTGKDMAAELIIPKAKVQSGFTFTMAASGDPSTFDFVMDAFPGYTRFNSTKKQMCVIQIVGVDKPGEVDAAAHIHTEQDIDNSPSFEVGENTKPAPADDIPFMGEDAEKLAINQNKAKVTYKDGEITVVVDGGVESLETFISSNPEQATFGPKAWIALDVDTGTSDIKTVKYNGTLLTQADEDEADSWKLAKGHFILYIKADDVAVDPKTITLSGDAIETTEIKITVA